MDRGVESLNDGLRTGGIEAQFIFVNGNHLRCSDIRTEVITTCRITDRRMEKRGQHRLRLNQFIYNKLIKKLIQVALSQKRIAYCLHATRIGNCSTIQVWPNVETPDSVPL